MNERERALFCSCHANGDSCIISVLLLKGKIRIMHDVMSAYRFVAAGESNWHSLAAGKNFSLVYYEKILQLEKLAVKRLFKRSIGRKGKSS